MKKTIDGYWIAIKLNAGILDENGVSLTEFIYDSYQTCGSYVILVKIIPGQHSIKSIPKLFGVFSVKEKKFIIPMSFSDIEPVKL